MKTLQIILLFSSLLFSVFSQAKILSPTGAEVKVQFTASFHTQSSDNVYELISSHYQHLFGYFQSEKVVRSFGLDRDLVLGAFAPKMPLEVEVLVNKRVGGERQITYSASGLMIGHKKAVAAVLENESYEITMPMDLDNFYNEKCSSDPDYFDLSDFWYFYDPFLKGCSQLNKAPLAEQVALKFTAVADVEDVSARFKLLRGDNGNGELFDIYTVNGFAEGPRARGDEGRYGFETMNKWLRQQGFEETKLQRYKDRPIVQFEKEVVSSTGKRTRIRVTRLLAESSIVLPNVTFAKFFKEAIENGDVVIYAGHSGLGGNLDIPSLEEKAGKFRFNTEKRQLFYFDGCSTYSYYLTPFEQMKSRSKIDILFHGLESLFASEAPVTQVLLGELFDVESDPTWMEVLNKMDKQLDDMSFLTGVGSI